MHLNKQDALIWHTTTGITAHVVQDDNPMRPDEWENPNQTDWDMLDALDAGEVYGIVILDEQGEHLDSCWGFYEWFTPLNPDSYITATAREMLDHAVTCYEQAAVWVTI
jgi:hypothetical protein